MNPGYHEMGPIRPPSEGRDRSLLLRVTRNCPWNRCIFCATYKNKAYGLRAVEEIKRDIDTVSALAEGLKVTSWRLGLRGNITAEVVAYFVRRHPDRYGEGGAAPEVVRRRLESLYNVAGWLASGARTVFLQDANALQYPADRLVEVLQHLKGTFPSVERVTSYARSKTLARKAPDVLRRLRDAGLVRLHVGLESGCDEVLAFMQKGTTAAEHLLAGRKALEAGMELSEYYMPGLGGRRWSEKHALESARLLNEIGPHFIRLRTLVPRPGTPLLEKVRSGEFALLSEDEVVEEIGLFVENLHCRTYLASDQMSNLLWEVEGRLPEDKPAILQAIRSYLEKPLHERLAVQLERRLSSYLMVWGSLPPPLEREVEEAWESVRREDPAAAAKVQRVLERVKQAFV
ncbi:radical SAM protein [Desulfovirgula thermocuniculi]|uniref:radical SAM protein n=1 Tax=Desulfovirgula thermocuniculi TaxID=348842 RepID=UPI0004291B5D|nr:radical SAM protein [Desulfovirgula thermocuniculi]